MPPETEVIACPACRHLVRVPADWLGQPVQCPQCQSMFRAPVRDGDRLTEPELLSRPNDSPAAPRSRADTALWFAAFGLMLVGVVSVAVDTFTLVEIARDPSGYEQAKKDQAEDAAKKLGYDPKELADKGITRWQTFAALAGWGVACGAVSFLGGLGMARRRWYRLAQAGCVTAVLNVAGCCCVPGALFGVWGLVMLASGERRSHFVRV
jgi:hypothetical protein